MGVWIVDPNWYFHTAAVLGKASAQLASAVGTSSYVAVASHRMAGDDPVGTAWGTKYDAAAKSTIEGAAALSQAWSALAGRIYQAGVNHARAEFRAGNGKLPFPVNLPPPPPISQTKPAPPQTSVGNNGIGLTDVIPGLVAAVGEPVPNADTVKLSTVSSAWMPLATALQSTVGQVIAQVKPPDPSLPDATAFYSTAMSFNSSAAALSADATSLSQLSEAFSTATTGMRTGISDEIYATALELEGSAAVSILSSEVTGGSSVLLGTARASYRIATAGRRIYQLIQTLKAATSAMQALVTAFQPAMKAKLDNATLIPAEGFERNPDGTIKATVRYFDRAKWEAWQRYLQRGGTLDIDQWSKAYDTLMANAANGSAFDQYVAQVMGYDTPHGWQSQYRDADIVPGRIWDFANPDLRELVENKSGRLDLGQLADDEQALEEGWNVTYNINANYQYSASELARLQRLQDLYPGQFIVNRI